MTDNQKAATFIGWILNRECHGQCLPKGSTLPHFDDSHTVPCPDMTEPVNYIPALKDLAAENDYTFWLTKHGWMVLFLGAPWPQDPHPIQTHNPVELLAFIYDDMRKRK